MTHINWNELFYIDPSTGDSSSTAQPGYIGIPTYGNYGGGGGYSAGEFGGELLTKADGSSLSYKQLLKVGDAAQDPVDKLDYLFYVHDVMSAQAGSGYTQQQALADISLLTSIDKLNVSYDPEASLYAGIAGLGMIGDLGIHGDLGLLSSNQLLTGLEDAAKDIQFGLDHLSSGELAQALTGIFQPTSDPSTFAFDFSITTTTYQQEYYEFLAMNALNTALDFGESDYTVLNTGFPFPGTTDYELTYNVVTHDLDLLAP
jgi:hypothetical protein